MTYMDFFALTTRGLEPVTADEIAAVRGVTLTETAYRRISGRIAGSPARLLNLRTADDVFLTLAAWHNVGTQRSTLAQFTEWSQSLDLASAAAQVGALRRLGDPVVFSVSASFVGRRNYSADEIKQAVAAGVQAAQGWVYTPDDRQADVNLRVFIEHERGWIGMRLAQHALHERAYKTAQIAGSLKPSVAAALVRLAALPRGARLLDPCCGAGTIVAEAAALGLDAVGGDLSGEALAAARTNAPSVPAARWDAQRLPLPDGTFDAVVSNLPWGRQVQVDQALAALYEGCLREIQRVLTPGGAAVLLTSAPELLDTHAFTVMQQSEISLFGQIPTVTVLRAL